MIFGAYLDPGGVAEVFQRPEVFRGSVLAELQSNRYISAGGSVVSTQKVVDVPASGEKVAYAFDQLLLAENTDAICEILRVSDEVGFHRVRGQLNLDDWTAPAGCLQETDDVDYARHL